jgi:hypothetical protein
MGAWVINVRPHMERAGFCLGDAIELNYGCHAFNISAVIPSK